VPSPGPVLSLRSFDDRVKMLAGRTGYETACTSVPGLNRPGTPLLQLRRTSIQTSDSLEVFKGKLEGAFDWSLPPAARRWLKRAALRVESVSRRSRKRPGR